MKHLLFITILTLGLYSGSAQSEVTFYTSNGNFVVLLFDSIKPITAGNFKTLVDTKHYDGALFYRVISNFVVQGGTWPNYPPAIQDEFDSTGTLSNVKMTLSMANSGPNTGSSEFFINLKNNTFLDFDKSPTSSAHPIFGVVTSGWTNVEAIEMVPVDGNDKPITDVDMDSIRTTGSVLSLEEIKSNKTRTAIYPNPVNPESVLDLYLENAQVVTIDLMDINGRILNTLETNCGSGKTLIPLYDLGVSKIKSGSYIVVITGKSVRKTETFSISK